MDFMKFKTLKELGEEFKDRLKAIAKINTEFTGILSGFYSLDAITKGLPVMFGTEMLL
jgi:replicative DNA helicase